jgi:imidazolonepropionase-like amidohydrolase
MLDGEPPSWPGSRVVRDAASARAAVDALAREGVDCIKVHNGILPDAYRAVALAAAAHGLPVVAHLPDAMTLAALQGAELQHMMGLGDDWRDVPARRVAEFVEISRLGKLRHTPTLVVFARAARLDAIDELRAEPVAQLLPRYYRELLWDPKHDPLVELLSPGVWKDLDARVEAMQRAVRALHDAGIGVYAGTDTINPFVVPGASLHEELRLLAGAGLTAEQVWAAATRQAGAELRLPGLGRLAPGAPADLLVFREDPSRDLRALDTLETVVADGRAYPRRDLEQALARWREHFESPLYEWITMTTARAGLRAVQ